MTSNTDYSKNINTPILRIHHAALKPWDDGGYKVMCPACGDGLLLVHRDQSSLRLIDFDGCTRCAQRVRYLDAMINGEPVDRQESHARTEFDQTYNTPEMVAMRSDGGAAVCIDLECTLSGGMAHAGPCEPCACGLAHAVAECPKRPG